MKLLIVVIHGFHTIRKFDPLVWKKCEKLEKDLDDLKKYSEIKLLKIGYKNILYKEDWGDKQENNGLNSTIKLILKILDRKTELIIIGHSLGGFSANLLTGKLIKKRKKIKILVQIDPLPIITTSPVYTETWFEENAIGKMKFNFLPDKLKKYKPKHKFGKRNKDSSIAKKMHEIQEKMLSLSGTMMNNAQNLLDTIEVDLINPEFINDGQPLLHQRSYKKRKVNHHLYYYSDKKAWDITNMLVHLGTSIDTGPMVKGGKQVKNVPLHENHINIPGNKEIYNKIIELIKDK